MQIEHPGCLTDAHPFNEVGSANSPVYVVKTNLMFSDWDTSAPFCEHFTFTPGVHTTSILSGFLTPQCVPLSLTVYSGAVRGEVVVGQQYLQFGYVILT